MFVGYVVVYYDNIMAALKGGYGGPHKAEPISATTEEWGILFGVGFAY